MGFENMLLLMALLTKNALRKETDAVISEIKKETMDVFTEQGFGKAEQLIVLGIFKRFATELEAEIKADKWRTEQ